MPGTQKISPNEQINDLPSAIGSAIANAPPHAVPDVDARFPYASGTALFSMSYDDLYSIISNGILANVEALYQLKEGWNSLANTCTFVRADAPSYVISVNANVTGTIFAGIKFQLTHQSSLKNFIVTQVSGVTGTTTYLNLYGGTDYTLNITGAITSPTYSPDKSPERFPLDPDKWTVSSVTSDTPAVSSPTGSIWYGGAMLTPTGPSLSVPIGSWRTFYRAVGRVDVTLVAVGAIGMRMTLSTANNSESDPEFTTLITVSLPIGTDTQIGTYQAEKVLNLSSKTTYFLDILTGTAAATTMSMNPSGVARAVIKAVCTFL